MPSPLLASGPKQDLLWIQEQEVRARGLASGFWDRAAGMQGNARRTGGAERGGWGRGAALSRVDCTAGWRMDRAATRQRRGPDVDMDRLRPEGKGAERAGRGVCNGEVFCSGDERR